MYATTQIKNGEITMETQKERLENLIYLIEVCDHSGGRFIHEKANTLSIAKSYLKMYCNRSDKMTYAIERCEDFINRGCSMPYKKTLPPW
jgi:hypothetical protein